MATYIELRQLMNDGDLPNRVTTATLVFAQKLLAGPPVPSVADKAWANLVSANPDIEGRKVLMFVLAANKAFTMAQIQGASDEDIQTQVDLIAPNLVDALAGV